MRPECEQHYTPARDNQYRATARYYKECCPYCEIERLKGELEEARSAQFPTIDETAKPTGKGTMVVDCGTYSLELGREATALIKDLERQLDASQALLAEARSEVEALTDCLNGSRKATYTAEMYDKGVAKARREGWEQGKAEAKMLSFSYRCRKDIAAMEYGGEK